MGYENKVLKNKKLEGLTLKMTQNEMSGRIFVEFAGKYEKKNLSLQKNYPNSYEGKKEADQFSKKFKSIDDLAKYFRLK